MKTQVLICFCFMLGSAGLFAQNENSGGTVADYAGALLELHNQVVENGFQFLTYAVHEPDVQKANARREELQGFVEQALANVKAAGDWQGDGSLRESVEEVIETHLKALREDYVELWELRSQRNGSSEAMQAFFDAQLVMEQEAQEATERLQEVSRDFAKTHGLRLENTGDESPLMRRMKKVNQVNEYYRTLFLVYFKAARDQEALMPLVNGGQWSALKDRLGPVADSLAHYRNEANDAGPFDGDDALREGVMAHLDFYQAMVNTHFPVMIKVGAMPANEVTPADGDQYNEAITFFNTKGAALGQQFQQQSQAFLQRHIPKPAEQTKL